MQEIAGSRQEDFELAQERWGISSVSVYTASTRRGQMAVIRLETNNSLIDLQLQIAVSEEPFDRWLRATCEKLRQARVRNMRGSRTCVPIRPI
jgi:hypothetical protein